MTFSEKSIAAHASHIENHLSDENAQAYLDLWLDESHPAQFVHRLFWKWLEPIIRSGDRWLTVGDLHGSDAHFLEKNGADALASDLGDIHLKRMKAAGFIQKFAVENVERLSFENDSFDFVLCKEAYHHFPRPAIGFYEMLRVAKTGIVIQEPLDILSKMPIVIFTKNLLDAVSIKLMKNLWRNQYSYETVGNFVFKVSEREFEKMACALNLPFIAFRGFHTDKSNRVGSLVNLKLAIKNTLSWLHLIPFEQLSTIVFKQQPDKKTIENLQSAGYRVIELPRNPYL